MTTTQKRRQWQSFVAAFNNLGGERFGMSPEGASVLVQACAEFEKDNTKGFRPLNAGVPPCAAGKTGALLGAAGIVNIKTEYASCSRFWSISSNQLRAQVTRDACDYVLKHQAVFSLLNGLI